MEIIAKRPVSEVQLQKVHYRVKQLEVINEQLGTELTREKIKSIQQDQIIQQLGTEVASLKLQIMQLRSKGGEE